MNMRSGTFCGVYRDPQLVQNNNNNIIIMLLVPRWKTSLEDSSLEDPANPGPLIDNTMRCKS